MYKYEFNKDECWYQNICEDFNTEKCDRMCHRYLEMHYLMTTSGIPKKAQQPKRMTPDKVDYEDFLYLAEIKKNIKTFVDKGEQLYIYSNNFGNGKTTWAIRMLCEYFNQIWYGNAYRCRGLFVHVPTFLLQAKQSISNNDEDFNVLKKRLMYVDLVVWDDIAAVNLTDFDHLNLLSIIDNRQLSGLSNIFTGNLDREGLKSTVGDRLADRIWNASNVVELQGATWRGEK